MAWYEVLSKVSERHVCIYIHTYTHTEDFSSKVIGKVSS
jgi:hypothetical protein